MLTRERLRLLLAAIVVVGFLGILFATLPTSGSDASAAPPITKVLKRRHDRRTGEPNAAEVAELRKQVQQDEGKRTIKTKEFKDMPLKVKEVRNLDSETWHKDLEIEVKNVSSKPIYSILVYLEFPDEKLPGDDVAGIVLRFGERKYIDIRVEGDPKDPHLNPGDTYVFTIDEKYRKGLATRHQRSPEFFRHLDLHFGVISFGDGTGFEVGDPTDYRQIKRPSDEPKKNHTSTRIRSPPQDGCGSCARYVIAPGTVHVCWDQILGEWCESEGATTVSWAKCRLVHNVLWDCNNHGELWCTNQEVFDSDICPGFSPTPTPTPTPEPTCDPATKPNNTNCSCGPSIVISVAPQWSCFCFYLDSSGLPHQGVGADHSLSALSSNNGCSANLQNNGSDCCICPLTSCPEGTVLNSQACECQQASGGSNGGSGGTGQNQFPVVDRQDCVDYYWVHFKSYDGGNTWQYADDETYAGCYYEY